MSVEQDELKRFKRKVLFIVFVGFAIFLIMEHSLLLVLLFTSLLVAVIIQGIADWIKNHTPFGYLPSLLIVIASGVITIAGLTALVGIPFTNQVDTLRDTLPIAFNDFWDTIRKVPIAKQLLSNMPNIEDIFKNLLSAEAFGIFSGIFGALSSIAIIVFIAIYLAFDPDLYIKGVLFLFPHSYRRRIHMVLNTVARALRYWMIGRFTSMVAVGVLTGFGLWVIDIPLALSLGILAGLFAFVPIIGPIFSAIPGLLLGFSISLTETFYALVVYVSVQALEGNLITPLIQQRAVSLPPMVLLAAQSMAGALIGVVGIIMATPLTVALMVIIQMLYVQDVLGEKITVLGQGARRQNKKGKKDNDRADRTKRTDRRDRRDRTDRTDRTDRENIEEDIDK